MKNVMSPLVNSWFALLSGQISLAGKQVKVYPEDAAIDDNFHYVIIRAESETDESNKASFVTNAVVIVDIVTVHSIAVKHSIVNEIDDQIRELLFPTRSCNLPPLTGLQLTGVKAEGGRYISWDNGTKKYYRKVTRWIHRVTQTI